ncbi:MAG: hypothetical protein AB8H03_03400 [Saprospiraceae bacterium]
MGAGAFIVGYNAEAGVASRNGGKTGHAFNLYNDNESIKIIDGQTNQILDARFQCDKGMRSGYYYYYYYQLNSPDTYYFWNTTIK